MSGRDAAIVKCNSLQGARAKACPLCDEALEALERNANNSDEDVRRFAELMIEVLIEAAE